MTSKEHNWITWTARDVDILEALALKVRVLSLQQIAQCWWSDSKNPLADARKRIRKLKDAGLILRYQINTHPMLPLAAPIVTWAPRQPIPEFSSVAWQLKQRWIHPHSPTWVFIASRSAANLFASNSGKLKDPAQVTHDLHLSEVYLRFRKTVPDMANAWIGEDAFKKAGYGIKDPDAFIQSANGDVSSVIEFGGKYSAERVREFHEHCSERELQYELW